MMTKHLSIAITFSFLATTKMVMGKSHNDYSPSIKHIKRSDFLVEGLEEIEPAYASFQGDMYAGMIPIDEGNSTRGKLMFWLFAPYEPTEKDTMTIWFNGGPGCSSFSGGVLFENSPVTVQPRRAGYCCTKEDEPLVPNNHTWAKATYMLYVEQPAGTGFSYGVRPQSEDDVARDFVDWLTNFYHVFEDLADFDLFLFGESYAGMYVPSVARGIYLENKKRQATAENEKDARQIQLRGIGIGNGYMDVQTQGPAVIDFAYWHGMIDVATREYYHQEWKRCYASALADDASPQGDHFHAFTTGDECGIQNAVLESSGDFILDNLGPNTFDVTTWDTYSVLSGTKASTNQRFYNDPRVQKKLHAPIGAEWHGCQVPDKPDKENGGRRRRLKLLDHDRPLSMLPYLSELLDDAKIRVLVYNADLDLSVSAPGSEAALNRMQWSHSDEWFNADRGLWVVDKDDDADPLSPLVAGYTKEVAGLYFVIVRNSGHLVPYNVPRNGLDLLTRFIRGDTYADHALPNFAVENKSSGFGGENDWNANKSIFSTRTMILVNLGVAVFAFLGGILSSNWSRRRGYKAISTNV